MVRRAGRALVELRGSVSRRGLEMAVAERGGTSGWEGSEGWRRRGRDVEGDGQYVRGWG
jgi:hypothetical protein